MNFSFKNLLVWQKSMDYTEQCLGITEKIIGHYRLCEQLEACSASIPQNIAEGNGRVSTKEFIHFLYIARGSLYESVTILNIFQRMKIIDNAQLVEMEELAMEITKMLNSFITKQRQFLRN